jgi:hypothetical protein
VESDEKAHAAAGIANDIEKAQVLLEARQAVNVEVLPLRHPSVPEILCPKFKQPTLIHGSDYVRPCIIELH